MRYGIPVATGLLVATAIVSVVSAERDPQARREIISAPESSVSPQRAFLNRHCVSCHNAKLKNPAGALSLDLVDVDNVGENAAVWEKTVRKLHARAMPPAGPGRATTR